MKRKEKEIGRMVDTPMSKWSESWVGIKYIRNSFVLYGFVQI